MGLLNWFLVSTALNLKIADQKRGDKKDGRSSKKMKKKKAKGRKRDSSSSSSYSSDSSDSSSGSNSSNDSSSSSGKRVHSKTDVIDFSNPDLFVNLRRF